MSRRESLAEENLIDIEFSSGDSNRMNTKRYQEENNNEVDELSKHMQMGCIIDAVKKPPNICVENIVHEEESDSENQSPTLIANNDEDGYSDEFEEDKSEDEGSKDEVQTNNEEMREDVSSSTPIKLTKSQSSTSANRAPNSVTSGRSTNYGSFSVPAHHRRINWSFTNDRLRDIERQNHILLNKIINVRKSHKSSIPARDHPGPAIQPVASAAVKRKKDQRKIDYENMILKGGHGQCNSMKNVQKLCTRINAPEPYSEYKSVKLLRSIPEKADQREI